MLNYIVLGTGVPVRQTKVGQFSLPTSPDSSFEVTGVGFQPECVIFFGIAYLSGSREGARMHLGVATGASEQWGLSIWCDDNAGGNARARRWHGSKCIVQNDNASSDFSASLVSFDSDGFTLDVDDAPGSAYPVVYLAMRGGGSYKAGVATAPTSTGVQSISPGFAADLAFFGSAQHTADGIDTNREGMVMGAADGIRQHALWAGADTGSVHSGTIQSPTSTLVFGQVVTGAGSLLAQAECVGMGTSIDLDWVDVDAAYKYGWLAMENAAVDRFQFVPPDPSPTTEEVTTPNPPAVPVGLIGFNSTWPLANDDVIVSEGATLGFSACDSGLLSETSVSYFDGSSQPFGGLIQSGRDLRDGMFGCYKPRDGGLPGTGAGNMAHPCDIQSFLSELFLVPMNWRSADRKSSSHRILAGDP